jgi:iron complex transport system ATP-binding protein
LRDGQTLAAGAIQTTLTSANLSACFGLPVDCRYDGERWSARGPADWSRRAAAGSR